MATVIEELLVRLDATSEGLKRELERAGVSTDGFAARAESAAARADRAFGGLGKGIGVARAGLASLIALTVGSQLWQSFRGALDAAGSLGELSEQVRVSTDFLQAMRYAAAQVGVSNEELDGAFQKLTRSIGNAIDGQKDAITTFNQLGVGVLDAQGKTRSTEAVFRSVADALQRIKDPAERARLEMELFGRSGQQLAPLIEHGNAALDDFVTKAKAAGVVLDEETIKKADAASDKIAALGIKFDTLWQKIAAGLAGPAEGFLDFLDKITDPADPITEGLGGAASGIDIVRRNIQEAEAKLAEWQRIIEDVKKGTASALDAPTQDMIDELKATIEEYKATLRQYGEHAVSKLTPDRGEMARRGLLKPAVAEVTSNPPITDTGKLSEAEKQAKRLSDLIRDLQIQVDTFGDSEVDQKVAQALKGFDLTLPGAKEGALNVRLLIDEIDRLTEAQEQDKREVAEYDQIIAEASAEWDKRVAQGAALYEATLTPLEAMKSKTAEYKELLDAGVISQETYNRAVEQAEDAYWGTTDAAEGFRQAARDAFTTIQNDVVTAITSIQSMNDAIDAGRTLLLDLARIALNAGFAPIGEGLGKWFSGLFSGGGSGNSSVLAAGGAPRPGGGGGGFFETLFGWLFAGGGIMTSRGPAPLRKYSGGGVANTPQLAMFGEGSTPEAFVPVPNGRIPVELRGAGGGRGTTIIVQGSLVTLNAQGGTREQNEDLAGVAANKVGEQLRQMMRAEIAEAKRPGNALGAGVEF